MCFISWNPAVALIFKHSVPIWESASWELLVFCSGNHGKNTKVQILHKWMGVVCINKGCPENIGPFWISREPVAWPWCNLAASQRRPYCATVENHSPVGLVSRQWDAVDWACVPCNRRIHNDRASRSASSQRACPFYSSREGFFGKASHHPDLSSPLQLRFGSLRLPAFPKAKIAVEMEVTCECETHAQSNSVMTSWKGMFRIVITKEYNVMVNSEELIGTAAYLTL